MTNTVYIRILQPARLGAALMAMVAFYACILALPAYAATPSRPGLTDVSVSPTQQVTLRLTASTDASGHAIDYLVYRYTLPINAGNVGSASMVATAASTTIVLPASADETTQSYVWWYAVRARDELGLLSTVSLSFAPNPHTYQLGIASTCQRCHPIHGDPPGYNSKTPDLCYRCHGRTDADDTAAYGDKSSMHTQGGFFDYPDQSAGSKHRNATMSLTDPLWGNRECSACHMPHLSPYLYTSASEVSLTASFKNLLTVQTGVNASGRPLFTAYSRLSGSRKNEFCFACHGASGVNIAYPGGAGAYASSGGDHNESSYDTDTAHGTPVIKSNDHPGEIAAIQCLACHNRHASPAESLLDYRSSNTRDPDLYSEAGLCFACHSSASTENRLAAGFSAPFSWNDRDVEAEFGRTSRHPYSTKDSGSGALRCTNCHNTHFVKRLASGSTNPADTGSAWDLSRASDPDDTTLAISDPTAFCLRCHDGSPPQAVRTANSVVPATPSFRQITAPYFPGWNKAESGLEFTASGHYAPASGGQKALCKTCHDPHASDFARLAAWTAPTGADLALGWTPTSGNRANTSTALSREENLCYQCHGNGTTGKLAPGAKNVASKATLSSAHNPASYTGIHSDEETSGGLAWAATGSKRHAECVDCHDPHVARKASGSAIHTVGESAAGAAVYGAWGADPSYGDKDQTSKNWTAPEQSSYVATRIEQSATSYEAYLCFKCHSANTTFNPAYTDQALEFNPSNFSEHNVLGQTIGMESSFTLKNSAGTTVTVTWTLPAASAFLQAGWTTNSKMTCTDCHDGYKDAGTADPTTVARGPHGSTTVWLLDPDYANWTTSSRLENTTLGMTPGIICAKCHTGLGTVNSAHSNHYRRANGNAECRLCHVGIPHGWKRPRLIGYKTDPAPYATTGNGLLQISVKTQTPTTWAQADCNTSNCSHTKNISPFWP